MRTKDNIRIAKLMGAEVETNESLGEYVVFPNGVKIMANDLNYDSNIFSLLEAYDKAKELYGVRVTYDAYGELFESRIYNNDDKVISLYRGRRNRDTTLQVAYDLLTGIIDYYEKNK